MDLQVTENAHNPNALPKHCLLQGRYDIGRVLGIGGFGITYLAYDCKENCRVAVKELFPGRDVVRVPESGEIRVVAGQEAYFSHVKQRFLEEAQNLHRFLKNPDIVNVFHFFEENHTAYYVMEYLDGTDLKHFLRQHGKIGWDQLSVYIRMVLRALQALHGEKLIHRDISPDNIFLTKDGRALLIDFGSVRCYGNSGGFTTFLKECFAPLEQYRQNGDQGPWTDIYALCITMYYALSGKMPQKAPDRALDDQTVSIGELCPALPRHVALAIDRGMEIESKRRFQTTAELADALFPGECPSHTGTGRQRTDTGSNWQLTCVQGHYRGKNWKIVPGVVMTIGRSPNCMISYPVDSRGISRTQCTVMLDMQGRLYVRDEKSAYGTFLNGQRLPPMSWHRLARENRFGFAQEIYQIW